MPLNTFVFWRKASQKCSGRLPENGFRWRFFLSASVILLTLTACGDNEPVSRLSGQTMGTGYQIQIVGLNPDAVIGQLKAKIERELEDINQQMSTYRKDSELSRFNASPPEFWFSVSSELLEVFVQADAFYKLSQGAFDVTIGPLVNLWGFGPKDSLRTDLPPSSNAIEEAMGRIGGDHLKWRSSPPAIYKTRPLYVDLSAIAKGYAVDKIATLLIEDGYSRWLVEIGGEVRVQGKNSHGQAWQIGIERPDSKAMAVVHQVLDMFDGAVATSGNYRNFFLHQGVRYSHIIDPRNGWPVSHALASVTVLNESATKADGLATLLYVLGPGQGFDLAEQLGLQALFVLKENEGYSERFTSAFGGRRAAP